MAALPTFELDPPTISMTFGVNDSPLAGRDGTHVSSLLKFGIISLVVILHHFFTMSLHLVYLLLHDDLSHFACIF